VPILPHDLRFEGSEYAVCCRFSLTAQGVHTGKPTRIDLVAAVDAPVAVSLEMAQAK
jgi:hypothetical protein